MFCGGQGDGLSPPGVGCARVRACFGASRTPLPPGPWTLGGGGSGSCGTKGERGTPLKVTPPTGPDLELAAAEIRTPPRGLIRTPCRPRPEPQATELVRPGGRPVDCGLPPADLPAHMRPLPPPQAPAPPSPCRW